MKNYALIIKTPGGSVSDILYFDTHEEAYEEMQFYKTFYSDRNFEYELKKEC